MHSSGDTARKQTISKLNLAPQMERDHSNIVAQDRPTCGHFERSSENAQSDPRRCVRGESRKPNARVIAVGAKTITRQVPRPICSVSLNTRNSRHTESAMPRQVTQRRRSSPSTSEVEGVGRSAPKVCEGRPARRHRAAVFSVGEAELGEREHEGPLVWSGSWLERAEANERARGLSSPTIHLPISCELGIRLLLAAATVLQRRQRPRQSNDDAVQRKKCPDDLGINWRRNKQRRRPCDSGSATY